MNNKATTQATVMMKTSQFKKHWTTVAANRADKTMNTACDIVEEAFKLAKPDDFEDMVSAFIEAAGAKGRAVLMFEILSEHRTATGAVKALFKNADRNNVKSLLRITNMPTTREIGDENATSFLGAAAISAPHHLFEPLAREVVDSLCQTETTRAFAPTGFSRAMLTAFPPFARNLTRAKEITASNDFVKNIGFVARLFSDLDFSSSKFKREIRAVCELPFLCGVRGIEEDTLLLANAMGGPCFSLDSSDLERSGYRLSYPFPECSTDSFVAAGLTDKKTGLVEFALSQGNPVSAFEFLSKGVPFDKEGFILACSAMPETFRANVGDPMAALASMEALALQSAKPRAGRLKGPGKTAMSV